jgi:hypothetical protein
MEAWSKYSNRHIHSTFSADERALSPAGQLLQRADEPPSMYDSALHPEEEPEPLAQTTSSSPTAAVHPDCSGKSTVMVLLPTAVTVPTLE